MHSVSPEAQGMGSPSAQALSMAFSKHNPFTVKIVLHIHSVFVLLY